MDGQARAEKAYVLDGQECWSIRELVMVMAQRPEQAIEHLTGGYIGKWIENSVGDIDSKIALDKLLKEELPAEELLYAFMAAHWSDGAPPFMGVEITMEQLDRIARDDLPDGLDKRKFVCDLHRLEILPRAAQASGDDRLSQIDARWQKEFLDYCTSHAEMLSYEEIWNNPAGALEFCLHDTQAEAYFITNFLNGRRDDVAARCLSTGTKVQIFDGLFDAELAERCRFDRGGENIADLRKRAWFAEMLERDVESSLGRDHALNTAALVAAGEFGALKRAREANRAEIEAAGDDWPFRKLDQKAHAILYGASMAVAAMMGIWNPNGWRLEENYENGTTIALLVAAFYFATLYGAVAQRRQKRWIAGIALATLSFGAIPIAYLASGWWLTDVIFFGAVFALLGALRKPFIARSKKKRLEAVQRDIESRMTGSTKREDDPEIVLGYLEFYARGIPRDKIVEHTRRQQFIGESGAPGITITQDGRPRKSAPAAYQSEGLSYELAGMNIAADGAVTTDVMDGVSIDTRGRVNTRVIDGVTLHSDGKTTTNVTKGVDIRSDGQVSVEMFGMRHSWGGKKEEKKKDSWF